MSAIPPRRTTRSTRSTTNDIENAHAKPSRLPGRTRGVLASAAGEARGALAPTASSKAKTVAANDDNIPIKRKREALGEVTERNKDKIKKGDAEKTKDTEVAKPVSKEKGKPRQPLQALVAAGGSKKSITISKPSNDASKRQKTSHSTTNSDENPIFKLQKEPEESRVVPKKIVSVNPAAPRVFKRRSNAPTLKPVEEPTLPENAQSSTAQLSDDGKEDEAKVIEELTNADNSDEDDTGLYDDLDAEDWNDPAMCVEYVNDVLDYLKVSEKRALPKTNFIAHHSELNWTMRESLLDWLLEIHYRYQFLDETFFLCVNIIDRFLSVSPSVSLPKFQLLGVAALLIATKFEESASPSVADISKLTEGMCAPEEIIKAERHLLRALNYDLSYSGPMTWLRRGSKADDYNVQTRTLAKFLITVAAYEPELATTPASIIAASALWLGRIALGNDDWNYNMSHFTTYKEKTLIHPAGLMLSFISQPIRNKTLYLKYNSKRQFKISVHMREWTIGHWGEDADIDLAADLPKLKEMINEARVEALKAQEKFSDEE